jgi:hypothetical protein
MSQPKQLKRNQLSEFRNPRIDRLSGGRNSLNFSQLNESKAHYMQDKAHADSGRPVPGNGKPNSRKLGKSVAQSKITKQESHIPTGCQIDSVTRSKLTAAVLKLHQAEELVAHAIQFVGANYHLRTAERLVDQVRELVVGIVNESVEGR